MTLRLVLTRKEKQSLSEKLNNEIRDKLFGLDFEKRVHISQAGFFQKTLSLKDYLNKLAIENPQKLKKLLDAKSKEEFSQSLGEHRSAKLMGGVGLTTGKKLEIVLSMT